MKQYRFKLHAASVTLVFLALSFFSSAQLKWTNVDSLYQPLPKSVHVYTTTEKIDTGAFRAYYVIADLKDKKVDFTADTTLNRRLTPGKFYEKNNKPLVVVNCTFFSFETNRNLNVVIKNGKLVGYNIHTIAGKGKDTLTYRHPFVSAIGISKYKIASPLPSPSIRFAEVVWTYTDSSQPYAYSSPAVLNVIKDSIKDPSLHYIRKTAAANYIVPGYQILKKWKPETAVGGGPVLLQNGEIKITNDQELKFAGKAINDKHPRTAMGYTKDHKLIILVVQGRSESSGGATLPQEAEILKDLGCVEALNLDGGGSSCMLVNGKETIKPSDKEGERPVPAVFIIKNK
jgi:exopolysaccharide biosynthesis protein